MIKHTTGCNQQNFECENSTGKCSGFFTKSMQQGKKRQDKRIETYQPNALCASYLGLGKEYL